MMLIRCPECGFVAVETSATEFRCQACGHSWAPVKAERYLRLYRHDGPSYVDEEWRDILYGLDDWWEAMEAFVRRKEMPDVTRLGPLTTILCEACEKANADPMTLYDLWVMVESRLPLSREYLPQFTDDQMKLALARARLTKRQLRVAGTTDSDNGLSRLDDIPELAAGEWVLAKEAAKIEEVGAETLTKYRGDGLKEENDDQKEGKGIDPGSRIWRKRDGRVHYLRRSLKKS